MSAARAARVALLLAGVLMLSVGCALWLDASDRGGRQDTTVVTHEAVLRRGQVMQPANVTTHVDDVAASAATRSDTLILGLLTIGIVLVLVSLVYERVEEIAFAGASIRLRTLAAATQDLTERAREGDPAEAMKDFFTLLLDLSREQRLVTESDVRRAADTAVERNAPADASREIEVATDADGRRVVTIREDPDSDRRLTVTGEPQLLPAASFADGDALALIANPEDDLVLSALDQETLEALAAVRYRIPEVPDEPLLLIAIAIRSDDQATIGKTGALLLLHYLHAVSRKLRMQPGVFIRVGEDRSREQDRSRERALVELGFRPATDAEAAALPEGTWWVQRAA